MFGLISFTKPDLTRTVLSKKIVSQFVINWWHQIFIPKWVWKLVRPFILWPIVKTRSIEKAMDEHLMQNNLLHILIASVQYCCPDWCCTNRSRHYAANHSSLCYFSTGWKWSLQHHQLQLWSHAHSWWLPKEYKDYWQVRSLLITRNAISLAEQSIFLIVI